MTTGVATAPGAGVDDDTLMSSLLQGSCVPLVQWQPTAEGLTHHAPRGVCGSQWRDRAGLPPASCRRQVLPTLRAATGNRQSAGPASAAIHDLEDQSPLFCTGTPGYARRYGFPQA